MRCSCHTSGSLYKDGSYTGSVADAKWGVDGRTSIIAGQITRDFTLPDDDPAQKLVFLAVNTRKTLVGAGLSKP